MTIKNINSISSLILVLLIYYTSVQAKTYDPSASVFRFHQKMAERGVAESQLKLGLMYETGSGTRQSLLNARLWYKKAATQNYKPAINRLTYLQIKRSGFTEQNNQWLKNLKHDAQFNEGEALFLLGQMYSEGTGVNKSLTTSLELLRKAAAGNIPGSEAEIIRVEQELSELQAKYSYKKNKVKTATVVKIPAKRTPPKTKIYRTNYKTTTTNKTYVKTTAKARPVKTKTSAQKLKTPAPNIQKTNNIATTTVVRQKVNNIAIKTASKESDNTHPMDTICGGQNRFRRSCR